MFAMIENLPQPSDPFAWVQAPAGPALVCRALARVAPHLFTTRPWPLGSTPSGHDEAAWADVARAMAVEPGELRRLRQVHGTTVVAADVGNELVEGDILVSGDPARAIAVQSADCVPLLFADARTGCVAAAHAGWRGLAAGVPRVAVEALVDRFGSRPADLVAAVGPSISAARYEVDAQVRRRFDANGFHDSQIAAWFLSGTRPGHWQFDGWAAARDQLVAAGVPPDRVYVAGLCTASFPDVFCSYRRDGSPAGRMAAAIRMRRADAARDRG
jgi:purine-nucleoside/S-methyl-5'-thioadenosine phosphorylase / adenosine deaminase